MNCVVPDWIATKRLTPQERASIPPPIPLATISGQVIRLIEDDSLVGRAVVIERGEAPRLT